MSHPPTKEPTPIELPDVVFEPVAGMSLLEADLHQDLGQSVSLLRALHSALGRYDAAIVDGAEYWATVQAPLMERFA